MQIRNELALMRWRANNAFACPVVIRVPIGGYLSGGGVYHSQSGGVLFTHISGLRVVVPSNALDPHRFLRTPIPSSGPVPVLQPKPFYPAIFKRSARPGPDF